MNIRVQCLCIDTTDPAGLAGFWESALGWRRTFEQDDKVVLEDLGARRVDVGQKADVSWVAMADPAGNEFCVLRALTPEELAGS